MSLRSLDQFVFVVRRSGGQTVLLNAIHPPEPLTGLTYQVIFRYSSGTASTNVLSNAAGTS